MMGDFQSVTPQPGTYVKAEDYLLALDEIARIKGQLERIKDDPECDGTDGAHPAWWRGNDAAVVSCAHIIKYVCLNGKGNGVANEPWESAKVAVESLRLRALFAERLAVVLSSLRPESEDLKLYRALPPFTSVW